MTQEINAIYAISENGVIGKDNEIPWRLSNDLKRYKSLTIDKPIIMGRKTFESAACLCHWRFSGGRCHARYFQIRIHHCYGTYVGYK